MEEEINHGQIGRKFGLMFGLLSALITIGTGAARINLGFFGTILSWAVIISMFVFACREYKNENNGYMTFGRGFGIVMWVAFIGGIVRAVLLYVYTIFDAEYLDYLKEIRESSSFGPPRDNTQDMPEWVEFFNTGEFLAIATFMGAIFGGLIIGAIVAAILKREEEHSF